MKLLLNQLPREVLLVLEAEKKGVVVCQLGTLLGALDVCWRAVVVSLY